MTAILTTKSVKDDVSVGRGYLDFMADCVIYLDQRVREQVTTKRLQVIKYRGSAYGGNEYPFLVSEGGIHFNPISDIGMYYASGFQRISSGNPSLDDILGGGYRKGTCVLISGATGTGKTSIASTFVRSACQEGQKVLYVNYEESQEGMIQGMLSLGIDLRPAVEDASLQILSVMPESLGIEEQLFLVIRAIRRFKPQHFVIDAVSACTRIAGETAAFDFVMRLVDVCKKAGITVILINQLGGRPEVHEFSGVGISSVVDTVITLRYEDTGNELNRRLMVLKSRGTRHSNKYHTYRLTDQGMYIDAGSA
jgi:circadian clock protein KaiC